MLKPVFGSESSERVLAFLVTHEAGYASEIAQSIDMDLFAVQKQLGKFESAGLLASRTVGRTRVYRFDAAYPLLGELKSLIVAAIRLDSDAVRLSPQTPLPEKYSSFFWDYHFEGLSWDKDRDLIIRRLLTDGSWEALAWLRKQIGDADLRKWIIAHRGRGLSPRQLRFWTLVLALPKRQANAWVRVSQASPWGQR
jgi:DNA-binding transcriptional ArsR family regulator